MSTNSFSVAILRPLRGSRLPWILGALAAATALLFLLLPLTAAAAAALFILLWSAAENEWFLLAVIFLTPVGWLSGKADSLFHAFPARSNIDAALLVRCLVVAGFLAGRWWRGRLALRTWLRSSLAKASLGFVAAVAISALCSEADLRLVSLARVALRMTAYLGFFIFVVLWCGASTARAKKIVYVLLASTLVTALFALVQNLAGGYTPIWYALYPPGSDTFPWDWRSTSFLDYPNDLASYLNLILPLALAFVVIRGAGWRKLGAWTSALGAAALVCTQSRGGAIAFAFVLLAGVLVLIENVRTRVFVLCAVAALSAISLWAWTQFRPEHLAGDDLSSGATRLFLWGVAEQLFVSSPLHGVGWGNFQVLYGAYLDPSVVGETQLGVHSTYLGLLAETGMLGFLTFAALLVLAFWKSFRLFRNSRDPFHRALGFGVIGALVALVVQGFVEFQIAVTQIGILFWMLLALLVVCAPSGSFPARGN